MQTNRRNWLKQVSLGIAGVGAAPLESWALPAETAIPYQRAAEDAPVRLSSNENPYGPSPLALKAMTEAVSLTNRYRWELTNEFISVLAKKYNVTNDCVLLGAGSTDILDRLIQFCAMQPGSFVVADPSYTNWIGTAETKGLKKIAVPLTPDKKHDLKAMLSAIQPDTRMVYICNPNNPTGTVCERKALVSFIQEASKTALVVLDEAYLEFSGEQSVVNLTTTTMNLVVVKTFSKIYGLASGRIGYAIAHEQTIEAIGRLQVWANGVVGVVSAAAAMASLKDDAFVKECHTLNQKNREYTIAQLEKLNIKCTSSHTNFIYFSLAQYKNDFFSRLKGHNIQGTRIYEEEGKWSRITVGTRGEMEKFIAALG